MLEQICLVVMNALVVNQHVQKVCVTWEENAEVVDLWSYYKDGKWSAFFYEQLDVAQI